MLMDYWKFFDAMEPIFMNELMRSIGFDPDYCEMMKDIHCNLQRYIKIGKSVGEPLNGENGFGQGDTYSILCAVAMVSIQLIYKG